MSRWNETTVRSGGLDRAATVAAGALGLVGYLYALGGIVVWLRVQTAQLSPDGAIVAADNKHLLAIGVRVVAFELFLLLAIAAIVAVLVGFAILRRGGLPDRRDQKGLKFKEAWKDQGTLGGFIGPETALLLVTIGLSLQGPTPLRACFWISGLLIGVAVALAMIFRTRPAEQVNNPSRWRRWLIAVGNRLKLKGLRRITVLLLGLAIGFGIFLLPLLQGTILIAGTSLIYAGPFLVWPDRNASSSFGTALLRSGGLWTAVAVTTVVALAWVATPPVAFTRAVVESLDHSTSEPGAYLDRADGGVYLGTCIVGRDLDPEHQASTGSRITLVPDAESARVKLGQDTYRFDPGGRPSIWQTIKAVVGGGADAGTHNPLLHHPLRGQVRHVCGSDKE